MAAKASTTLPTTWRTSAPIRIRRAPQPVDGRTGRPDDQEADQRRQREQQTGVAEREAAHLVQVDDVERQHQAGADELEDDHREQQLALTGQVVPERAEREGAGTGALDIWDRVFQEPVRTVGESLFARPRPSPRLRLMKRLVGYAIGLAVVVLVLCIPAALYG